MPHTCQSCLITCIDYRLHQRQDGRNYIAEFIKNLKVDCDVITRAGGILDLIKPAKNNHDDSVVRDAKVSTELHKIKNLYLLNHEDCGAYGNKFSSRDEEVKQHQNDLLAAGKIILNKFPHLNVESYFAELKDGTADIFTIKKL